MVNCWKAGACRELDNRIAFAGEEQVAVEHERVRPGLAKLRKNLLDIVRSAGGDNTQLLSETVRSRLQFGQLCRTQWIFGVLKDGDPPVVACGKSSCINSIRLGPRARPEKLTPVMLPSGRLKLATRPDSTGSAPDVNTIGIVAVAALAACTEISPPLASSTAT